MKAVIQRVKHASVTIDGNLYSKIGHGLLVLFCVEKGDTNQELEWMCRKIPALRIFEDENDKMNRSLLDTGGEILAVSQFTLAGNCKKAPARHLITLLNPLLQIKCMKNFAPGLPRAESA